MTIKISKVTLYKEPEGEQASEIITFDFNFPVTLADLQDRILSLEYSPDKSDSSSEEGQIKWEDVERREKFAARDDKLNRQNAGRIELTHRPTGMVAMDSWGPGGTAAWRTRDQAHNAAWRNLEVAVKAYNDHHPEGS